MAARKKGEPPNRKKTTVSKTTKPRKSPGSNPSVGDMWHYKAGDGRMVKMRYTAKGWVTDRRK